MCYFVPLPCYFIIMALQYNLTWNIPISTLLLFFLMIILVLGALCPSIWILIFFSWEIFCQLILPQTQISEEMDKFSEPYDLPKLNQEYRNNLWLERCLRVCLAEDPSSVSSTLYLLPHYCLWPQFQFHEKNLPLLSSMCTACMWYTNKQVSANTHTYTQKINFKKFIKKISEVEAVTQRFPTKKRPELEIFTNVFYQILKS